MVLDLDETLIHYMDVDQSETVQNMSRLKKSAENLGNPGSLTNRTAKSDLTKNEDEYGGYFLIRPGAQEFLKRLKERYELVIFTAAMQDYADWVLDTFDTEKTISHRLYRQHAVRDGPVFVKDLANLGRDIEKMIIVDNVAQNFQRQQDNGIHIKSWFDDRYDTALPELMEILLVVAEKNHDDIRVGLREVLGGD